MGECRTNLFRCLEYLSNFIISKNIYKIIVRINQRNQLKKKNYNESIMQCFF
jgi:hypothetical protein